MLKRILKWFKTKVDPKPNIPILISLRIGNISKIEIGQTTIFDRGQTNPTTALNIILDYLNVNHDEMIWFTDAEWNKLYACLNTHIPLNIELNKIQLNIHFKKAHEIQL